jgi:hypothetical protein
MKNHARAVTLAALSLALVAPIAHAKSQARAKGPVCPAVSVLKDATRVTQMENGRIDLKAEIREPALSCSVARGKAQSKLSFWVKSAISPMSTVATRSVPYFVAIISEGQVIGKEVFNLAIPFADGKRKLTIKESVARIDIPIAPEKTVDDYAVTIGFQLTEEQVNYNRTASR